MGMILTIYIISVIILLLLFRDQQKPASHSLMVFFPIFNSILVLLLFAISIIKWTLHQRAHTKMERTLSDINKLKAQGTHIVQIDGKKYRITKEDLFK